MLSFTRGDDKPIRKKEDVRRFLDNLNSNTTEDFEIYFKNLDENNSFVIIKEKEEWSLLKRENPYKTKSPTYELEGDIHELLFVIRKSINHAFYSKNGCWDGYEM